MIPAIIEGALGLLGNLASALISKEHHVSTKKWRKLYKDNISETLRKEYLKNKIYIQPYITSTLPKLSNEPSNTEPKDLKLLKDYFVNEVFIKEPDEDSTVFFLFGDSGTGKSAALVNLFVDYIKEHNAKNLPFKIRLISLREDNALDQIKRIPDEERKNYILLLDAMDETPEVKGPTQFNNFLNELKTAFHDYARVVITCRPQFFKDNSSEKDITDPEIRTSTDFVECTNYYLAPFNNEQVQEYLDRAISYRLDNPKRRKAEEIVNKYHFITFRPLILTYIQDIVEHDKPIDTTLDLYDIIIQSILKRDIKKTIRPRDLNEKILQWWEASSLVAKYMYENQKLDITDSELDSILPNDIDKQFKQRSLLTRYGNTFHFSHKSFYEYFMAYRFLQHPEEIKQVYGMDFALQIYNDALQAWSEQKDSLFADLKNTHPYTVAISLNRVGIALKGINHFSDAEKYYKLALKLFRQLEKKKNDTYKDDIAGVLINLAGIYWKTNHLDNAIKKLNEALSTFRQLSDKNPNAYLPDVAMTLNNLGLLHRNTNQYKKAEEEYNEALTTYRQLADKNPNAYLPYVATTLNNLAILHKNTNQLDKAEEEYNEALTTYRQLADKNPDAYLPYVATTLNNLANLHLNTNQLQEAEEEYNEALTIRRQLAAQNSDAYLPDVAMTLNNLATLHSRTNQYKEAEEEYNEALTIRRQLADKYPDAYLPNVADTLENLAILHKVTDRLQDAEEEYKDVLSIRQKLADRNPDAYLHKVAQTLFNMTLLYLARKEYDSAEAAALESLEKFRIMAEKSHAAFDPKVKKAEELLERIRKVKVADA